jgi:hypothetical protein
MADLIDLFGIVSDPLKVAWVLWIGWGVAQVGWYRRSRQQSVELGRGRTASSPATAHSETSVRRSTISRAPLPLSRDRTPWDDKQGS